jgi:glycosyltransferase involved in cell wall biosynthesis
VTKKGEGAMTIGLCMIVKNESQLVLRCLESVRPLIDYVLIEDTGSTDGTQALIRGWLDLVRLPGELYDEPWQDFAYNRSHALARLREMKDVDYALIMDADDVIVFDSDFDAAAFKRNLSQDMYDVDLRDSTIRYRRPLICSNRLAFRFRGLLHEFLEDPPGVPISHGTATSFYVSSTREGARGRDPEKYRRDAALLEKALQTETDPFLRSRYTFYLAQSCRDAGERERALEAFLQRAELGYWSEEIFISLYAAGQLRQALGRPADEVIASFMRACEVAPSRAESLHAASRLCRENKNFRGGYEYAQRGLAIPLLSNGLFVEAWVYDYGLLDEFAVNAYWIGRYDDCLRACERMLREEKIPAEMRERVENNAQFAREKLAQKKRGDTESGGGADADFVNLYQEAQRLRASGGSFDEVITGYGRASTAAPWRAEALHDASRLCRENNMFARGYEYARHGLSIPLCVGGLAVQKWIYDYGLLDELAVNAYWVGRYQECLEACQRLLRENKIPAEMRERVKKNAEFAALKLGLDSIPIAVTHESKAKSAWVPERPSAGTELTVAGLRERLGTELDAINLKVNHPGDDKTDPRPLVVWMHHDMNQSWVQWCHDKALVGLVDRFVFVSYWHRQRYLDAFGLPPGRCVVLRHAIEMGLQMRRWQPEPILRCAYTSTPFRGLSILLEAWEQLSPANAELHIWSSMKLYLEDDGPYEHLYAQARALPGVVYHGLAPNPELRAKLRSMHFFAYPCTFAETACLSAIEAMAAGCRLITSSLGALPETTAGYARLYPSVADYEEHVHVFSQNLAAELARPWAGDPELSLSQQAHCAVVYDWPRRLSEWRELIEQTRNPSPRRAASQGA